MSSTFQSNKQPGVAISGTKSSSVNINASGKGVAEKSKDFVKGMFEKQGPIMIFIIAVVLVFIIVILYITFAMKNSNLKGKILTKKPIKMDELSVPFQVSSSDIPRPAVGREYTYSFWIYVEDFAQTTNNKMIFYRGSANSIVSANPIVMMDSKENRMYIAIKTQGSTLLDNNTGVVTGENGITITNNNNLKNVIDSNIHKNKTYSGINNKHIILEIDYVPLQRWVNIVAIIDNSILTLFMDGEIYSVKSTTDIKSTNVSSSASLIVDKTEGDIFIGTNAVNNKATVTGYLSGLAFHNYAVSISQIKSIYNSGPLIGAGLLASMGISYSIRSPIYKLNETQ